MRLVLFAGAERMLVDATSTSTSLVNILQGVELEVNEGSTLPENAAIPYEYSFCALWYSDTPSDEPQIDAKIDVQMPDGTIEPVADSSFTMNQRFHRWRVDLRGLRVGQQGVQWYRLHQKTNGEWLQIAEVPVIVDYKVVPQQQP